MIRCPTCERLLRENSRIRQQLLSEKRRNRSLAAQRGISGKLLLEHVLENQGLTADSPKREAFITGWINGKGRAALQIPLMLEQTLRDFYAAGHFARKGYEERGNGVATVTLEDKQQQMREGKLRVKRPKQPKDCLAAPPFTPKAWASGATLRQEDLMRSKRQDYG